ncbi:fucose 4-O-acetylase [Paenibacillus sp. JX-17]|uniref:Fucose 4-O-acetylase n=1 Tax=Paenibacillus lacisoli TaxID=3064525 RepID=A0ABT9CFS4_9BACL|nr:fucose 4-O-acetylase [Paenibacillus sp. JX-17]MDO7908129.1 fucose 4-O-acetylase [Paenibacillus sp. JX-17]
MNSRQHDQGETFFLNLRFLLILCVFVGNAIEPLLTQVAPMQQLYQWIFTFHMPLFVWVTGYFAKSSLSGGKGKQVLLQIAVQYVIFQSVYSILDQLVFQVPHIHRSFFAPYLLLWFLASHFCWRLLLLGMQRLGLVPAVQIAVSALLGVLVGYLPVEGIWLSVSRTFVFLPFFMLGYHLSYAKIARWLTPGRRLAAGSTSAALLLFSGLLFSKIPAGWLYGSMTFGQLGHHEWFAGVYRIGVYGLQAGCSIAFIGLVPLAAGAVTEMGRRTLYVFLLHGLIIRAAAASGMYNSIYTAAGAAAVIAGAVLMTLLLTQRPVRRAVHLVIEPEVGRLAGWIRIPARHSAS